MRGSRREIGRLLAGAALVVGALGIVPVPAEAQSTPWEITRLAPLAGDTSTQVNDVNASGFSVGASIGGFSPIGLETDPVVWSPDGTPTLLPEPVSGSGMARAINADGYIVGEVITSPVIGLGGTTAVFWAPGDEGYEAITLGTGSARDISDVGIIVGAIPALPIQRAAIFRPGLTPVPLEPSTGTSSAERINDPAVVIGWNELEPVAWANGTRHELYQLLDAFSVEVLDVTNSFFTLGKLTVGERTLAFAQAPAGAIFPLAPTVHRSSAVDMNEIGIAAGTAQGTSGPAFAALFVYGTSVAVELLIDPTAQAAWVLEEATALNDAVAVVGNGTLAGSGTQQQSWMVRPAS